IHAPAVRRIAAAERTLDADPRADLVRGHEPDVFLVEAATARSLHGRLDPLELRVARRDAERAALHVAAIDRLGGDHASDLVDRADHLALGPIDGAAAGPALVEGR